MSAVFPSIAFILLIFLLQKLKEEIAEVFAEIECFQNAEERQEADNNRGEQTRQVRQDGCSFVYGLSLDVEKTKTPMGFGSQGQENVARNTLLFSEISLYSWTVRHLSLRYLSYLVSELKHGPFS